MMSASNCTKCTWRTKAPVPWFNFSCHLETCWNKPLFLVLIIPGSDTTKAGTHTSAGGTVTGKANKAAIGEMLDSQVADLKTGDPSKVKDVRRTTPKNPKRDEDNETKKLQKDIKAFLNKIHLHVVHMFWEIVFKFLGSELFATLANLFESCSFKISFEASGQRPESQRIVYGAVKSWYPTPGGLSFLQLSNVKTKLLDILPISLPHFVCLKAMVDSLKKHHKLLRNTAEKKLGWIFQNEYDGFKLENHIYRS